MLKKLVIAFLLVTAISGCTKDTTTKTTVVTTPGVVITESSSDDMNIPKTTTDTSAPTTIEPTVSVTNDDKPYDFSVYYETDVSIMDQVVPNGPCSGDMTIESCIEYYGSVSSIPDGIYLKLMNEDDTYRYYSIENTFTGSSIEIAIVKGLYDSSLSDVSYSLNDNNELLVSFYFDYTDEVIDNNDKAYDIEQRYYQTGGPIYSHTIYHLMEGSNYHMYGDTVGTSGNFILVENQSFDYLNSMEDVDYASIGVDYLRGIEFIKIIE